MLPPLQENLNRNRRSQLATEKAEQKAKPNININIKSPSDFLAIPNKRYIEQDGQLTVKSTAKPIQNKVSFTRLVLTKSRNDNSEVKLDDKSDSPGFRSN